MIKERVEKFVDRFLGGFADTLGQKAGVFAAVKTKAVAVKAKFGAVLTIKKLLVLFGATGTGAAGAAAAPVTAGASLAVVAIAAVVICVLLLMILWELRS